jgi:hypothetical protein
MISRAGCSVLVFALLTGSVSHAADLPPIDWGTEQSPQVQSSASMTLFTPRRIIGSVSFGVALLSVVVGIVFGARAINIHQQLLSSPVSDGLGQRESLVASGEAAKLGANISWGAAGAFGVAGGLLWIF